MFCRIKNSFNFASRINIGAVVQLVRISACHAEGRGFESRPLRHMKDKGAFKAPFSYVIFELKRLLKHGSSINS